ncbi:16S rRNA (cytosine(1402)-N(4))-methyltransferase RsmH [Desulfovibrio sp. OttesenSCG-928-I05]|nr:16S rRNA (cytosine(1402)-N(4))-methyltransferase RsmH [Desulfovibrio sp. OttesenSCG-928-I05]
MSGQAYAHERHVPVLLREVLECLAPKAGGLYLDGTLGLAGHAQAVLDAAPGARLLGLDRDEEALELAAARLAPYGDRARLAHGRFSDFEDRLDEIYGTSAMLDGALVDIGVSSLQIDSPERGFSFMHDGPLDMRMDPGCGAAPASRLVNQASFDVLKDLLEELGEEPQAGRIARAVIKAREREPITGTAQLAAIVEAAYPPKWRATSRNHPATRTFQALRLAVNDELGELKSFLTRIVPRLAVGGRLAVISFHSLEDRVVKNFLRAEATECICPPHIPLCVCGHKATLRVLTKKPLCASAEEVRANPRAGSAKLRAAEKLDQGNGNG